MYFKESKVVIFGKETYYCEPSNVCRELAGGISAAFCNFSISKKVSWAATEMVPSGKDLCVPFWHGFKCLRLLGCQE